jgi:hypothetical protein
MASHPAIDHIHGLRILVSYRSQALYIYSMLLLVIALCNALVELSLL